MDAATEITNLKAQSRDNYQTMSLPDLCYAIYVYSDTNALWEFHENRTVFWNTHDIGLLFIEYINELRLKLYKIDSDIADQTYNLTLDKFTNMPSTNNSKRGNGPDCRTYFRAFHKKSISERKHQPKKSEIEKEIFDAHLMQGLVKRQFNFSRLECERKNNEFSRYEWNLPKGKINLYFPRHIHGNERRKWLEKHIPNPDLNNPNEKERIQEFIDRYFCYSQNIPFNDEYIQIQPVSKEYELNPILQEISSNGFAEAVAKEKAETINTQREKIRELGCEKLKRLILRIFEAIRSDQYRQGEIATAFNLSKQTMSRFAGKKWFDEDVSDSKHIPDLWLNTCQVLSKIPEFVSAAKTTRLWEKIGIKIHKKEEKEI